MYLKYFCIIIVEVLHPPPTVVMEFTNIIK